MVAKERILEEKEKREEEDRRQQEIRDGKKYGRDFDRYTASDLKDITDVNFLKDMRNSIWPAGQPQDEWEFEELRNFEHFVNLRISELENE